MEYSWIVPFEGVSSDRVTYISQNEPNISVRIHSDSVRVRVSRLRRVFSDVIAYLRLRSDCKNLSVRCVLSLGHFNKYCPYQSSNNYYSNHDPDYSFQK